MNVTIYLKIYIDLEIKFLDMNLAALLSELGL